MIRNLALASAMLLAGPALAGSLPTSTATLPAADLAKVVATYKAQYEREMQMQHPHGPPQRGPDGKPVAATPAPAPLTDAQVLQKITDDALAAAVNRTNADQRQQAAAKIAPIAVPK